MSRVNFATSRHLFTSVAFSDVFDSNRNMGVLWLNKREFEKKNRCEALMFYANRIASAVFATSLGSSRALNWKWIINILLSVDGREDKRGIRTSNDTPVI
jgi:hypothetical protein